jgi:aspartyl/asparaginyl-tRNA synthetase
VGGPAASATGSGAQGTDSQTQQFELKDKEIVNGSQTQECRVKEILGGSQRKSNPKVKEIVGGSQRKSNPKVQSQRNCRRKAATDKAQPPMIRYLTFDQ